MDFLDYISEIHFASPFFMVLAAVILIVLFFVARKRRKGVACSYIGFFHKSALGKPKNPLFWAYRAMPYFFSVALVLAVGTPIHEDYEVVSYEATPYTIVFDFSGSQASFNYKGDVAATFDETVLNTFRLSLMQFIEERKATSEFSLFPYSDTPYAARYFAGGKNAEAQILGYLQFLPKDIQRWEDASRKFYLQGTYTAFALEAAARYRLILPEAYQQSVYIILTDFQDAQTSRIAKAINSLIEDGLERCVYILVMSQPQYFDDRALSSFQEDIAYPEFLRIFHVQDKASLDVAFNVIGESEGSPQDLTYELLHSESLQHILIYALALGTLSFIALEELLFRRIP